ncbi:MAG: hypothetical protein IKR63_02415 [Alloprevotella sp.]|nr:hypothetical protein [Alloprevotella sp.]
MKSRFLRSYIILILYALFALPCTALQGKGKWSMQAKVDNMVLRIGEQTTLRITLTAREAQSLDLSRLLLPKEIEVLSWAVAKNEQKDDEQTWQVDYIVTCFAPANYQFQPTFIAQGDSIRSDNVLRLNVQSVELTGNDQPRAPHSLIEQPFRLSKTFIALLLMFLLTTLMLLRRYKAKKKVLQKQHPLPPIRAQQQPLTPAAEAIRAINALRSHEKDLNSNDYYTQLSAILRLYIAARFDIQAQQQTSSQIIEAVEKAAKSETLTELQNVLHTADLAKFARHELTLSEQDGSLLQALAFVEKTKVKAQEDKPATQPALRTKTRRKTDWLTVLLLIVDAMLVLALCPYLLNLFKIIFA